MKTRSILRLRSHGDTGGTINFKQLIVYLIEYMFFVKIFPILMLTSNQQPVATFKQRELRL